MWGQVKQIEMVRVRCTTWEEFEAKVPSSEETVAYFAYSCSCGEMVACGLDSEQRDALVPVMQEATGENILPLRNAVEQHIGQAAVDAISKFITDHFFHFGRGIAFYIYHR